MSTTGFGTTVARSGALATVLHSCARYQDDRRIALFSRFLGSAQLQPLPTAAWRYLLSLLQCLREVQHPARFEAMCKDWAAGGGVITLSAVIDVLGADWAPVTQQIIQ